MSSKVDKMIERAIYLAGPGNLGYSQGPERWNVWDNGSADCASFVLSCAKYVGIPIDGATYTGDMPEGLSNAGWNEIGLSQRHRGCFVVRPKTPTRGGHTAMIIDDYDNVAEALMNEYGTAMGGRPGDQTGNEVTVRQYNGFATRCFEPPAFAYEDEDIVIPIPQPEPKIYPEMRPDMAVRSEQLTRLYNTYTGAHMMSSDPVEIEELRNAGWQVENVMGIIPMIAPIYRLYNPNNGDHLFTSDLNECNTLIDSEWSYEGVGAYGSIEATDNPVYRFYNPHDGTHVFTSDEVERSSLSSNGWQEEGIAFYLL